jgi:hypothetical protein
MRVLFIHGLESHPNGSKTRALRSQGFEVVAADLQMGVRQLGRRNSFVRQLLRLPAVRGCLVLLVVGIAIGVATSSATPALGACAVIAAIAVTFRRRWAADAIGRSFDACVAIARDALRASPPDVVVGSSWGGAVAAELVRAGDWSGRTVLLAPAISAVHRWSLRNDASAREEQLRARSKDVEIVCFHDPSDEVIPFADSVALAAGTAIDLRSVDGGGHRLMALVERGEVADAIRSTRTRGP